MTVIFLLNSHCRVHLKSRHFLAALLSVTSSTFVSMQVISHNASVIQSASRWQRRREAIESARPWEGHFLSPLLTNVIIRPSTAVTEDWLIDGVPPMGVQREAVYIPFLLLCDIYIKTRWVHPIKTSKIKIKRHVCVGTHYLLKFSFMNIFHVILMIDDDLITVIQP